ncbi:hypothetical protein ACMFMF_003775 [Clarireedia jacksonii]
MVAIQSPQDETSPPQSSSSFNLAPSHDAVGAPVASDSMQYSQHTVQPWPIGPSTSTSESFAGPASNTHFMPAYNLSIHVHPLYFNAQQVSNTQSAHIYNLDVQFPTSNVRMDNTPQVQYSPPPPQPPNAPEPFIANQPPPSSPLTRSAIFEEPDFSNSNHTIRSSTANPSHIETARVSQSSPSTRGTPPELENGSIGSEDEDEPAAPPPRPPLVAAPLPQQLLLDTYEEIGELMRNDEHPLLRAYHMDEADMRWAFRYAYLRVWMHARGLPIPEGVDLVDGWREGWELDWQSGDGHGNGDGEGTGDVGEDEGEEASDERDEENDSDSDVENNDLDSENKTQPPGEADPTAHHLRERLVRLTEILLGIKTEQIFVRTLKETMMEADSPAHHLRERLVRLAATLLRIKTEEIFVRALEENMTEAEQGRTWLRGDRVWSSVVDLARELRTVVAEREEGDEEMSDADEEIYEEDKKMGGGWWG